MGRLHRLHGVDEQVQDRRSERVAVEHHRRQLRVEVADDLDARLVGLRREEIEQLRNLDVQAAGLERELLLPREVEEVAEQLLEPVAFLPHQLDLGLRPPVALLGGGGGS